MSLFSLPNEIVFKIISFISDTHLSELSKNNQIVYNILNSDYFWLLKCKQYNFIDKPFQFNWKEWYSYNTQDIIKPVPIYFKNTDIGFFWIQKKQRVIHVIQHLIQFLLSKQIITLLNPTYYHVHFKIFDKIFPIGYIPGDIYTLDAYVSKMDDYISKTFIKYYQVVRIEIIEY